MDAALRQWLYGRPWAILPDALEAMAAVTDTQINAAKSGPKLKSVGGKVAVMSIVGPIDHRPSFWLDVFGGISLEWFNAEFDRLIADSAVGAVVLDIDSPGGSVYGLEEAARRVFEARGAKPIVAVANGLMASAAYYLGSSADKVFVSPSSQTGSIGTVGIHIEQSKRLEDAGYKVTIFRNPPTKYEGSDLEPLTDEAKAEFQREIDAYSEQFRADVARNRETTKADVEKNYGRGRVLMATEAVEVGMADGVKTLEQVIRELVGQQADAEAGYRRKKKMSMEAVNRGRRGNYLTGPVGSR